MTAGLKDESQAWLIKGLELPYKQLWNPRCLTRKGITEDGPGGQEEPDQLLDSTDKYFYSQRVISCLIHVTEPLQRRTILGLTGRAP